MAAKAAANIVRLRNIGADPVQLDRGDSGSAVKPDAIIEVPGVLDEIDDAYLITGDADADPRAYPKSRWSVVAAAKTIEKGE
jgi:hypothetical protein